MAAFRYNLRVILADGRSWNAPQRGGLREKEAIAAAQRLDNLHGIKAAYITPVGGGTEVELEGWKR